jgi:hypothetical protein
MKNLFNRWMSIVVLITIFVFIASAGSHPSKVAATTREPVLVTNNSEEPVPVQVLNTPTVQAQQGGSWATTINNTATNKVPVVATESGIWSINVASVVPIKDINNIAHDPFCITLSPTVSDGDTFTVPANKRLVIDQFSAFDNGHTVESYIIYSQSNGINGRAVIPVTVHASDYEYANQPVCIIADAGSNVDVSVIDTNSSDTSDINVDIHGYYVDSY